jgi:hypothetical protein
LKSKLDQHEFQSTEYTDSSQKISNKSQKVDLFFKYLPVQERSDHPSVKVSCPTIAIDEEGLNAEGA